MSAHTDDFPLPTHFALRDIRVFHGESLRGDLHVVPEGLFFLREPPRFLLTRGALLWRGAVLIGVSVLVFVLVSRVTDWPAWIPGFLSAAFGIAAQWFVPQPKRRGPEPVWRSEIVGVPLDRAVERLRGSFALAWEEVDKVVSSISMVQLWHRDVRRTLLMDLHPLQRAAMEQTARDHSVPLDGLPGKAVPLREYPVRVEGEGPITRDGTLTITPGGLNLEVRRSSSRVLELLFTPVLLCMGVAVVVFHYGFDDSDTVKILLLAAFAIIVIAKFLQSAITKRGGRFGQTLRTTEWPFEDVDRLQIIGADLVMHPRQGEAQSIQIGRDQEAIAIVQLLALFAPDRLAIEPGD